MIQDLDDNKTLVLNHNFRMMSSTRFPHKYRQLHNSLFYTVPLHKILSLSHNDRIRSSTLLLGNHWLYGNKYSQLLWKWVNRKLLLLLEH